MAKHPEKSSSSLIAAIAATIAIVIAIFLNRDVLTPILESEYNLISVDNWNTIYLFSQLNTLTFGCMFNWIGYITGIGGLTLTGAIFYTTALLASPKNIPYILIPLVWAYMGYSEQRHTKTASASEPSIDAEQQPNEDDIKYLF